LAPLSQAQTNRPSGSVVVWESLSWSGAGVLEQTESLTAPKWQPAPSQANPQTNSTAAPMLSYRVKQ